MMMNGRKFMTGLGIGMVAGGALCMMMAPKAKRNDGCILQKRRNA